MRPFSPVFTGSIALMLLVASCVDPYDPNFRSTVDVLIVDGTITNLPEAQIIRLNRSKADPVTGLPGSLPVTKAVVQVIVDSAQAVDAHETTEGNYQLPNDFRGQIGHAYQLRFTLSDGTHYVSTQQVMPAVPPISQVRAQFNPTSLPVTQLGGFTAAHDIYLDTQDPVEQANYYRWDWKLWEKQDWCRTCVQGAYSINNVVVKYLSNGAPYYVIGNNLFEDCFYPPPPPPGFQPLLYFVYDYECRTQCWAILSSYQLNVFADSYTNGGLIAERKVAQIPFYQHNPCLVEIRQAALTSSAYRFYKQLQDQTQNNGGVADTPPTASVGNVLNSANPRESVIGVFTASAVSAARYWLDRRDTQGIPPGLFQALKGREPSPEPAPPNYVALLIIDTTSRSRPYTAVCAPSESQTPFKPAGWQE